MTAPLVGVLGGGQLGRMLALSAHALGLRIRVLDPDPACPAGQVAERVVGRYDDESALLALARGADATTVEFENVPASAAYFLQRCAPFAPGAQALAVAQERLAEKSLFEALGIPCARFAAVESRAGLERAAAHCGLPAILKTRRLGYDGKGQFVVQGREEFDDAWRILGGVPLILEELIPFRRELSIIAVRARTGETRFYPLVQNTHAGGILRRTLAPAPDLSAALQQEAEGHARRILDRLDYTGVLTVEFFERRDGVLAANEMACRVHNSGHWTIEGAACSQFENHLRAALALPLGDTAPVGRCAMLNIIGREPDRAAVLALPGVRLHMYGKEPRRWRKLGHATVVAGSDAERDERLAALAPLIPEDA